MIRSLTWPDARQVAERMREVDRTEICATACTDDPVEAVAHMQVMPVIGATVWRDGAPESVIGAMLLWPGVWSMFLFATDAWPTVALATSKFTRRVLLPALRDAGAHRLQCYSAASHETAHRWIRWVGADEETRVPKYGKNREDFVLFGMSRWALERVTSAKN